MINYDGLNYIQKINDNFFDSNTVGVSQGYTLYASYCGHWKPIFEPN